MWNWIVKNMYSRGTTLILQSWKQQEEAAAGPNLVSWGRAGLRSIGSNWAPQQEGPHTGATSGVLTAIVSTSLCSWSSSMESCGPRCFKETGASGALLLDAPPPPTLGSNWLEVGPLEAVCGCLATATQPGEYGNPAWVGHPQKCFTLGPRAPRAGPAL